MFGRWAVDLLKSQNHSNFLIGHISPICKLTYSKFLISNSHNRNSHEIKLFLIKWELLLRFSCNITMGDQVSNRYLGRRHKLNLNYWKWELKRQDSSRVGILLFFQSKVEVRKDWLAFSIFEDHYILHNRLLHHNRGNWKYPTLTLRLGQVHYLFRLNHN
jgi:hypothetical protein